MFICSIWYRDNSRIWIWIQRKEAKGSTKVPVRNQVKLGASFCRTWTTHKLSRHSNHSCNQSQQWSKSPLFKSIPCKIGSTILIELRLSISKKKWWSFGSLKWASSLVSNSLPTNLFLVNLEELTRSKYPLGLVEKEDVVLDSLLLFTFFKWWAELNLSPEESLKLVRWVIGIHSCCLHFSITCWFIDAIIYCLSLNTFYCSPSHFF